MTPIAARHGPSPARRRGGWVAVGLLGAATLAGCKATTSTSSVSPCFRVLPEAHQAVGNQGDFVDVARLRGPRVSGFGGPSTTASSTPATTAASPPPSTTTTVNPRRDVCLVAYRGTFDPSGIPLLVGPNRSGRYAVVIVGVRSERVRAVVLTDTLPAPLHRH